MHTDPDPQGGPVARRRLMAWLGAALALSPSRLFASATLAPARAFTSAPVAHALRLRPGDDLRTSLFAYAERHRLRAAAITSCAGSVQKATIRCADQREGTEVAGPLEIVSLSGTLAAGSGHLHIAVSDATGRTTGGHLLAGSPVYTTAEIVLIELPSLEFRRERDAVTTYEELVIRRR